MTAERISPVILSEPTDKRRVWSAFGRRFAAALHALAAGMAASKDYRHLNAMSDSDLLRLGLTRNDIPREIHRRHFAERPTLAPALPSGNSRRNSAGRPSSSDPVDRG